MRITEKMNSRSMSWNRMDTNFRADQLREVGVPEEFIDTVKGLDFAEIEQRYPEIAEWLEESAGVWNEPKMAGMFEDPDIMSIGESSELDSLKQELKYWEDRAIQIGLIGSDQELIEADDIINEITDKIKQLEATEATGIFLVTDDHIERAVRNGMPKSEYSKLKDADDDDGIRELINKYLNIVDKDTDTGSWQKGGEANPLGASGMWNTDDPDPDNDHIGWKDMFDDVIPDEPSIATGMLDDGTGNFYCPICSRTYVNMSWDNAYNHASSFHNMREDKAKDFANTMTSSLIKNAFETLPADYDWRDVHNDRVRDALDGDYNGALGMDSMVGMNQNQWGYSKQECPNCGSKHWNPASMNLDDDRYKCTNCGTIYDDENKPISDDMSYTDQDGYVIKQTDPQIQRGRFSFQSGGVPDITPQDAFDNPRKFYESISKESMEDELQEWFDSLSSSDVQKIGSDVNEFASLLEQTPEVQDQLKTYYTFNVLQNQGVDSAQAYDITFDGHLNSAMGLSNEDYYNLSSDDYDDMIDEEPDDPELPDEYYELKNHDRLNFDKESKANEMSVTTWWEQVTSQTGSDLSRYQGTDFNQLPPEDQNHYFNIYMEELGMDKYGDNMALYPKDFTNAYGPDGDPYAKWAKKFESLASENACPECSGKIIKDEYDGGYVCKTCGRKYKRADGLESIANEDSLIKIEDNEDEDTQVTVLDEWQNETDPDVNGKTKGIGEGGYGSGKNSHGFGHKKWMRGAELNDDIIDAEDMHRNQFLPMQVEESKANEGNREDFEQWWRTLSTSERDDLKTKLEPYVHDADYIENGDYDSRNHFYRHWYNHIRQYEPQAGRRRHYR